MERVTAHGDAVMELREAIGYYESKSLFGIDAGVGEEAEARGRTRTDEDRDLMMARVSGTLPQSDPEGAAVVAKLKAELK